MKKKSWLPLRALRKEMRLTLEELSDKSGVACSDLSRIERGTNGTKPDTAEKILLGLRAIGIPETHSDFSEMHIMYPKRYKNWPEVASPKRTTQRRGSRA